MSPCRTAGVPPRLQKPQASRESIPSNAQVARSSPSCAAMRLGFRTLKGIAGAEGRSLATRLSQRWALLRLLLKLSKALQTWAQVIRNLRTRVRMRQQVAPLSYWRRGDWPSFQQSMQVCLRACVSHPTSRAFMVANRIPVSSLLVISISASRSLPRFTRDFVAHLITPTILCLQAKGPDSRTPTRSSLGL